MHLAGRQPGPGRLRHWRHLTFVGTHQRRGDRRAEAAAIVRPCSRLPAIPDVKTTAARSSVRASIAAFAILRRSRSRQGIERSITITTSRPGTSR